jgi:putative Holliday junction resolvase
VRLGVDVGSVRVGVAASDPSGVLATPLVTLPRTGSIDVLARLVEEHAAVAVVVGLPRSLSGRSGPAAEVAQRFAAELAAVLAARSRPVAVHLTDERLTTVIASRNLTDRGVRGRRQRAVVDQAAAVLILQSWLDREGGPHGG